MTSKKILVTVTELRAKADEKEKKKQDAKDKEQQDLEMFLRCKEVCICNYSPCSASNLKQCPSFLNVMKSVCSKFKCRKTMDQNQSLLIREMHYNYNFDLYCKTTSTYPPPPPPPHKGQELLKNWNIGVLFRSLLTFVANQDIPSEKKGLFTTFRDVGKLIRRHNIQFG